MTSADQSRQHLIDRYGDAGRLGHLHDRLIESTNFGYPTGLHVLKHAARVLAGLFQNRA